MVSFLYTIIIAVLIAYMDAHSTISAWYGLPHVRLTRDLLSFEKYDRNVQPIENHSKSLKVHISMSLYQLIDVNERSQYLSLNVWMIQKWVDELLDWDPHEYDMINYTVFPFETLWIPDTVVYNRLDNYLRLSSV